MVVGVGVVLVLVLGGEGSYRASELVGGNGEVWSRGES